ncbi:cupredoxin domain-containing protein [Chloroflexus sp. Y-396-1]|uniref:cupredoxin domain-containing protein n=1 Tax=Chloroflexus sp. Y-396-1 TaxID=867845 RepID=UPI001E3EB164|nr:cupredoxin domain-containing protein [Chloroflexus sp. Y-396-1]
MMSIRWLLVLLTFLLSACATPTAAVDLTIRSNGCTPATVIIPPEREPKLTIRNTTTETMVVSIPTMDRWIEVAPGTDSVLELPRYIMGSFDLFCLSATDHSALDGDNPFLCVLEPAELMPVARSAGILVIEPHDRIREILGK